MATLSKIEWTDTTWNPVTGCTKISYGCKHCYAERMSKRLQAMGMEKYRRGFEVVVHESVLKEPLKWKNPSVVFVNSMSDLFHKVVPSDFVQSVFEVMNQAPQHTFQVLTKRPGRGDADRRSPRLGAKYLVGHEYRVGEVAESIGSLEGHQCPYQVPLLRAVAGTST